MTMEEVSKKWILNDSKHVVNEKNEKVVIVNSEYSSSEFKYANYQIYSSMPNTSSYKTSFKITVHDASGENTPNGWQIGVLGYASNDANAPIFLYNSTMLRISNGYAVSYERNRVNTQSIEPNLFDLVDSNVPLPYSDINFTFEYRDKLLILSANGTRWFSYTVGKFPIDRLNCVFAVFCSKISLEITVTEDTCVLSFV